MNLVGTYHQHHHHVMHDSFLLSPASRCHQERPYFSGWVFTSPASEVTPEFGFQTPYGAEIGVPGPAIHSHGRLEAFSGRLGRRRGASGPKKERRRTESINSAFAELRECIPNVPADTKLSKIKTLRLATSYIAYLMDVLAKDNQAEETEGFNAELKQTDSREGKRKREANDIFSRSVGHTEKKMKGRTGWPQQVWALELGQ